MRPDETYGCDGCPAICCMVPPAISSVEEMELARENNAPMVAVVMGKANGEDVYAVSVVRREGEYTCPFLRSYENAGGARCGIYERRFFACRDFECQAIGMDKKALWPFAPEGKGPLDTLIPSITKMTTRKKPAPRPVFFSGEIVRRFGIPVVSREEAIEKINSVPMDEVISRMSGQKGGWRFLVSS